MVHVSLADGPQFLSDILAGFYTSIGWKYVFSPNTNAETLQYAKRVCSGRECLPFLSMVGKAVKYLETRPPARLPYFNFWTRRVPARSELGTTPRRSSSSVSARPAIWTSAFKKKKKKKKKNYWLSLGLLGAKSCLRLGSTAGPQRPLPLRSAPKRYQISEPDAAPVRERGSGVVSWKVHLGERGEARLRLTSPARPSIRRSGRPRLIRALSSTPPTRGVTSVGIPICVPIGVCTRDRR